MELDLFSLVENDEIECKKATGGLPKDLWETYSAFANTDGGAILLGIKEEKGKFYPIGVEKPENIIKDLWDNLNNPKRVSSNILSNNSVDTQVIEDKITDNLNIPFRTIDGIRQEDTRVHKAVREAVANAIIHADYRLSRGIVIEKGKTYFKFFNPGNLRITREEALKGGLSDPRNENIFKMFNLLGIGERAGSGIENIHLAWREQKWIVPDLEETYDPDRITLILKTTSILPKENIEKLKLVLKEKYSKLSKDEVMALVASQQEDFVTNNRLQQLLNTHTVNSNKILSSLVDKGFLETDGIGRGTKYHLSSIFDNYCSDNTCKENNDIINDVKLNETELKILDCIKEIGFITNTISREKFGLTKHRSTNIFNSLILKEKIERVGVGSQTKYILKK